VKWTKGVGAARESHLARWNEAREVAWKGIKGEGDRWVVAYSTWRGAGDRVRERELKCGPCCKIK
jgi:hypothetical protein